MSQPDEPARNVLRRMGALSAPGDLASDPSRQYRVAATIDAQLEDLSRRRVSARRWQRVLGALAAAAAVVVGIALARRAASPASVPPASAGVVLEALQGSVAVAHEGQPAEAAKGPLPLAAADEVRTGQGSRAQTRLKSGALATVEESSVLVFGGLQGKLEELTLRQGKIELSVPHLEVGSALLVRTPDALVTVHGTQFSVAVSKAGERSVTRVTVAEGTVWVEHATHTVVLSAGGSWSSDAQPLPVVAEVSPEPALVAPSSPARSVGSAGSPAERSTLAEENRAYLSAMTAARAGDDRRAVQGLEALLAQHPGSPLAQSAEAERFRALSRLGRTADAARAARHYLSAYPEGFAAADARALVGGEH